MPLDRDHWCALARDLNITYDIRVDTEALRVEVESKFTSIFKGGHGDNRGFKGVLYQYFEGNICKVGTVVLDSKSRHVASIGDIRASCA